MKYWLWFITLWIPIGRIYVGIHFLWKNHITIKELLTTPYYHILFVDSGFFGIFTPYFKYLVHKENYLSRYKKEAASEREPNEGELFNLGMDVATGHVLSATLTVKPENRSKLMKALDELEETYKCAEIIYNPDFKTVVLTSKYPDSFHPFIETLSNMNLCEIEM